MSLPNQKITMSSTRSPVELSKTLFKSFLNVNHKELPYEHGSAVLCYMHQIILTNGNMASRVLADPFLFSMARVSSSLD